MAVVAQRSEKVKRSIEDTGLPFDILIDDSRDVMKIYGVWHRVGFDAWNIARPAVFLIDTDRTIGTFVAGSQSVSGTRRYCGNSEGRNGTVCSAPDIVYWLHRPDETMVTPAISLRT